MHDFTYYNPTEVIFGRQRHKEIGSILNSHEKRRVLLVYGEGSIVKNGLYDEIVKILKEHKIEYYELSHVMSNPTLSKVHEGVAICKEHNIDALLGVGGGSVVDTAKAIALGSQYGGDVWDFFIKKAEPKVALDVYAIMTLAASASEVNGNSVITNQKTEQKYSVGSPILNPRVSIINPELMHSVSPEYLAYSAVDVIAHAVEVYFSASHQPEFNSYVVEAIVKRIMNTTTTLLNEPNNYDARAEFAWVASQALNGSLKTGTKDGTFANHMIEHSISALFNIAHGAGLSIVMPAWMRWYKDKNKDQFQRFAYAIFNTDSTDEAITKLQEWFDQIGSPTKLHQVGIDESSFDSIVENIYETAKLWGLEKTYTKSALKEIIYLAK